MHTLTSSLLAALLSLAVVTVGCADSTSQPRPQTDSPSHPARIQLDGDAPDWQTVPVRYRDAAGDGTPIDLGRLWMAHDENHVFFRVEVGASINLQEDNDLTLFIDADADSSTGLSAAGLGAELAWTFGDREGRVAMGGRVDTVTHANVGFASLPTFRSTTFEIAFDRAAQPTGDARLFASDTIRVALRDGRNGDSGDRLPDAPGGVAYALGPSALPAFDAPTLGRLDGDVLRLVSYNVARDDFFDVDARSSYTRLLRAMQPDVIGFQEVYEHTADETGRVVESILDPGTGVEWHRVKLGLDLVAVSRYPIRATHTIEGYDDYASGAVLLDTEDVLGTPTVMVMMHPPCCNYADAEPTRDVQRQVGVDAVAAFLRDLRRGEGPFEVAPETPVVVLGDMNFVGDPQQPHTLRTGAIADTARFGPGAPPDSDGSPLLDVNPRQTNSPLHATWANPESSFPPGRLDYVYVSDSVLDVVQSYVLNTATLAPTTRAAYTLEPGDTQTASDHYPLVVDVATKP